MAKVTLEYNLPEDAEEFEYAKNGILYSIVLDDFDNILRSILKYESEQYTDSELKLVQSLRDQLNELKNERDLK